MLTGNGGSLTGIRVVNLATNLPGPLAARHLQRLGASVTKVEPPGGDAVQAFPKWYRTLTDGQTVEIVDLKTAAGQAHLAALLNDADLLISAMRPRAAKRLHLYDLVEQAAIVHVEIVGDLDAPEEPGHDLTYQAAAGVLNPPEVPRVPWADVVGGYQTTIAGLDALREREHHQRAGRPGTVHRRVGLKQGVDEAAEAFRIGATAPGHILSGRHPAYSMYRTSDGWIAVAAIEPHFYATLTVLLGDTHSSLEHQFATRSTAAWLQFAQDYDLPISAVRFHENR